MLEMKETQRTTRKKTRVSTTAKRISGRQLDLAQAQRVAKSVKDIKVVYETAQRNRTSAEDAIKREETNQRRAIKKEAKKRKALNARSSTMSKKSKM